MLLLAKPVPPREDRPGSAAGSSWGGAVRARLARLMMATLGMNDLVAGKYRLIAMIGEGGLGQVWSARHELLGGDVALKFLKPTEASKADAVGRFLREARAASALRSDHVCKVFDVGTHEGMPFLVMEKLDGEDLGSLLDHCGTLQPSLVAEIVVQACHALAEAHALGIIHRDIKPENLFVLWRGDRPIVKVLDFGLATGATQDLQAQRLTATTTTFGTPLYMAPEQLRAAKNADARSDLWSLGVVLFFASAGRHPYVAEAIHELCIKIATEPAPPLGSVWLGAPPDFAAIVDRCLARDPARRFASVAELADALRPLARPQGRPMPLPPEARPQLSSPDLSGHSPHAATLVRETPPFGGTMSPVSSGRSGGAPAPKRPVALLASGAIAGLVILGSVGAIAARLLRDPPPGNSLGNVASETAPTAVATAPTPSATALVTASAAPSPPTTTAPSAPPVASVPPVASGKSVATGKTPATGKTAGVPSTAPPQPTGTTATGANGSLILH
jgi:serine/threonine protein kinase